MSGSSGRGSSGRGSSGRGGKSSGRRGGSFSPPRRYPRLVRVNENLREVLAEAIARIGDTDARLTMATVTAVECEADFHAATVLMSSLDPDAAEALEEARVKLQAIVARQVRLKRTPLLHFAPDPAVAAGRRIEDILRTIGPLDHTPPGEEPAEEAGGDQGSDRAPGPDGAATPAPGADAGEEDRRQ